MNAYVNQQAPQGYTPQQTTAAFNQRMAQAHAQADMRYNMKPLDRGGMSRGQGQAGLAGISSAQNLADGLARAYGQNLEDAQTNAQTQLRGAAAREGLGQNVSQLAMQTQYADALASLQRQQIMGQGVLGGLMGGNLTNFLGY
jgi:hypothetical protein